MPKVGIVISNYNGWQDTLVCLDSLQKQTFTDFEVILIDDASPNDSVAQLQNKLPPNTVFLPQAKTRTRTEKVCGGPEDRTWAVSKT